MAKGYELEGKIHLIEDIQEFKSGFTKREFVVESMDGQYAQQIKFELVKDKTSLTDSYQVGDDVKVFFDIRGNEYNGRYFVNLNAWKLEGAGAGGQAPPAQEQGGFVDDGSSAPPSHLSEPPAGFSDADDEVPF